MAYASIIPYSAYKLSPYRIRYGEIKFCHIRRINTIYYTADVLESTYRFNTVGNHFYVRLQADTIPNSQLDSPT